MASIIQIRRDTAANWTAADTVLASGELGTETDTGKLKIGDGTTAWTSVAYYTLGLAGYVIGTDVLAPDGDGSALTGLPSATTSASDLTSGTLPDARFPTTLPALNGSALTNLPTTPATTSASDLTSGTLADARFPSTLPALDGSALTNLPASGIGAFKGNSIAISSNGSALAVDDGSSNSNIGMGVNAGNDVTTGEGNILLGNNAGEKITTGGYNVAMSYYALSKNLTGNANVAFGGQALQETTASDNVAVGYMAGMNISTGAYNNAFGREALKGNTSSKLTGSYNVGVGYQTGYNLTTAEYSVAIGNAAMGEGITTGDGNIAIGREAGHDLTSATDNIFMGKFSGAKATTGHLNIGIGGSAMSSGIVTGNYNIALGSDSGRDLTSGAANVFLGQAAGKAATTGVENIAIGPYAMSTTAVTGAKNIVMGNYAGNALTTGSHNNLSGYQAGHALTTGQENLLLGKEAGKTLTTNGYNVVIGGRAGKVLDGDGNVIVGWAAGGYRATAGSTSDGNVCIGQGAMDYLEGSSYCTAIGYAAGNYLHLSGSNNMMIGNTSEPSSATVSNEITLGNSSISRLRVPGLGIDWTSSAKQLDSPILKDYSETKVAMAANAVDLSLGNVQTKTITSASTLTFTNPPATGSAGSFTLILTNGGSATITWPTSVDWPAATAPTLTASGIDILVFTTIDGGTNWYGVASGIGMA